MPYDEMAEFVEAKLSLLTALARERPKHKFTTLAYLLNEGFLAQCYRGLGRNKAAGIDGVSWEGYGLDLEENLTHLVYRMKAKKYWPQPVRRAYIPKDEHSQRPLGIPALEDKIVQKGGSRILEAIYEADFLDCSYGFRPGKSCHDALEAVNRIITRHPINHVVEADIKGFFDNVSHEWMMDFLKVRINDPSFLRIIERFLKAGYRESGMLVETEQGTPQGGNLSPMLANIFLHYVLDLWFEKAVKPKMRGECHLVRYADDFLVLVQYQEEAARIAELLRERFRKFDLELHPEKTRVMSFGRYERENSARQKRKPNTFDFLGLTHYCKISRTGQFTVGRRTCMKKFRRKCKELAQWLKSCRNRFKLPDIWKMAAAKLRGHFQYYGVSGNAKSIWRFYLVTLQLLFKWLNRRSQRRSWNSEEFALFLKRWPLPKPRISCSFYTLSEAL